MKYAEKLRQISAEDGFARWLRGWVSVTPSKSKIDLCLDRNLPSQVMSELRSMSRVFRVVHVSEPNEADDAIYQRAGAETALIVTNDEDFWDDVRFPLRFSPGVIIVKGASAKEIGRGMRLFLAHVDVVDAIRRMPSWASQQKFKISPTGFVRRTLTYHSRVDVETIEY